MTKEQLQQELLEKVKPGTKPSQLKKSKSLSDLPTQPKDNLPKRKSLEIPTPPKPLKVQLSTELNNLTAENTHLKEQAGIKQKEVENLRQQLEAKTSELTQTQQELDKSLQARHQGLKDFGSEYEKRKLAETELNSTVEESAEELTTQDQRLTKLRSENFKLKQTNQSLRRDLTLVQKLAESRKVPYQADEFSSSLNYFKYVVYGLLTVGFMLFLISKRSDHD